MVVVEQLTIGCCFILRVLFQFQNPERRSMKRIRTIRIIPGIVSLPIVSIAYVLFVLDYVARWTPGTWAIAPLPVFFIIGWILFVVIDSLYQFHMISEIPD